MVEKKATLPEQESADLVEKIENKREDVFELSTGVILRLKERINPSTIIDILSELEKQRPEAPIVYLESFGREEVNYDDPDYIENVERWEVISSGRMADALILKGTSIEFLPEDMPGPSDNEWIEELEVLGFRLNRHSVPARYLAWVKHVAMQDEDDWKEVMAQVGRLAGVNEADVRRAQDSFPGKKGQG